MVGVDVGGGQGRGLFAAGRGSEELLQLGFHQIKSLLAAQDQRLRPVSAAYPTRNSSPSCLR